MATTSDSKTIDRVSQNMGLADRYLKSSKAGGAFNAYDATSNTMIKGATSPFGFTKKSRDYTISPGFEPNITGVNAGENFNEKALNHSDKINGGVKKEGSNKIATSWNGIAALQDKLYTVDEGFKLKMPLQQTQLKDAVGTTSKQLSLYMKGFNNIKYMDGKFTR